MIDLATAKKHLRVVASTAEDDLIQAYLAAARGAIENATGKLLAPAVVTQPVSVFPRNGSSIRLWKGPVASDPAPSIKYDDPNGVEQTLADYRLIEGSVSQLLPAYGAWWPSTALGAGAVRLVYTAGYADGEVPAALDQAVLFLTAHFYANREAAVAGNAAQAVEMPLAVDMLIAPYRTPGIA